MKTSKAAKKITYLKSMLYVESPDFSKAHIIDITKKWLLNLFNDHLIINVLRIL